MLPSYPDGFQLVRVMLEKSHFEKYGQRRHKHLFTKSYFCVCQTCSRSMKLHRANCYKRRESIRSTFLRPFWCDAEESGKHTLKTLLPPRSLVSRQVWAWLGRRGASRSQAWPPQRTWEPSQVVWRALKYLFLSPSVRKYLMFLMSISGTYFVIQNIKSLSRPRARSLCVLVVPSRVDDILLLLLCLLLLLLDRQFSAHHTCSRGEGRRGYSPPEGQNPSNLPPPPYWALYVVPPTSHRRWEFFKKIRSKSTKNGP